jgi:crotonobetainyl-CoA:carnitine CoA-transferase CaiB-like acyl-CoA transferase
MDEKNFPLKGLKVIDMATMMAAPWAAAYLGDYGAEVIKIEHPKTGDGMRKFGALKDGQSVFWKTLSRNKRCITLDVKRGQAVFLKLIQWADVLIENFRPGTMEKWGLGWEVISAANPRIIWLRVSGFGQEGPYAARGGFGTVAESMCGFAALNGYPDSPPTLPPNALADGVCSAFAAMAIMIALYEREVLGSGKGQIIDISLYEPLMRLLEGNVMEYSVLGLKSKRMGSRIASAAPRNLYQTRGGRWISLSGSAQAIAENVFRAIGRPELIDDPRFCDNPSRVKNVEELDAIISKWIGEHSLEEVMTTFLEAQAVVGPVYEMDQLFEDEHFKARESLVEVEDEDFGTIKIPNTFAKFSRTPGAVQFTGGGQGAENQKVYCDLLGLSAEELKELQKNGVV